MSVISTVCTLKLPRSIFSQKLTNKIFARKCVAQFKRPFISYRMHTEIAILDLSVKHIALFLLGVTTDSYFTLFELITMNIKIKTIRPYFDGLLIYGAVSLRFGEICMFQLPE
jgi:hypothetical protein